MEDGDCESYTQLPGFSPPSLAYPHDSEAGFRRGWHCPAEARGVPSPRPQCKSPLYVHLVLSNWLDGTPWDVGDFAITTPGSFAFDMPDWLLNRVAAWSGLVTFTIDATFIDDHLIPAAVYLAEGYVQLGNRRDPYGAITVPGNVYELNFDPRDDVGTSKRSVPRTPLRNCVQHNSPPKTGPATPFQNPAHQTS
ncbi:hypothetical protein EO087_13770 [Dyella sp. M7H15-1]|uniref:hypothetical protein n=1 Tax=Dyella sp. M7H15-1 TaxID=2501295 RepID=UPI0010051FBF|nr:hypothetical protein [Dyella sp. M7H15-1]QAU24925.1 hypothetical protein EO087_13770 [Dyella sp. M7H15-1]